MDCSKIEFGFCPDELFEDNSITFFAPFCIDSSTLISLLIAFILSWILTIISSSLPFLFVGLYIIINFNY